MKIGFIGAGNMGGAIAKAVSKATVECELYIADYNAEKAAEVATLLGGKTADNNTVVSACDVVFLGVKPQVLGAVLEGIAPKTKADTVFVSMAAGVKIEKIQEKLGANAKIIRIMPNTPVSVGSGMILYACSDTVTAEEEARFLSIMEKSGDVDKLPEALIDAGCAVSGCGPAFVYLFAEALADGGVACGLPRDKARRYAAQMIYGAADLLKQSEACPGELKDAVCSPGGSTIRGVMALEENGLRGAVMDAVICAFNRTVELG